VVRHQSATNRIRQEPCPLTLDHEQELLRVQYQCPSGELLRGRFVAVNYTETASRSEPSHSYGFLRLWDLKRSKRRTSIKDVEATDIEIGPQGQLFWIGRPLVDGDQPRPPLSVYSGNRVLATGNIEPKSLVLGAQLTVSWTQDGVRRCSGRQACAGT